MAKKKTIKEKKKGSFILKAFLGGFFVFFIVFGAITFSHLNLSFITSPKNVLGSQAVVDPQTGEFYDLQITSSPTLIKNTGSGPMYSASTVFTVLGGARVSTSKPLYGYTEKSGDDVVGGKLINFKLNPNIPVEFISDAVLLGYNGGCISLYSSTDQIQANYYGTFCYVNSFLNSYNPNSRVYSLAGDPWIELTYSGKNPTVVQFLSSAYNKFAALQGTNGNINEHRVNYLTYDYKSSSLSDYQNVVYHIGALTSGLSNVDFAKWCSGSGGVDPIKYLKLSWAVKPEGGSDKVIKEYDGACNFSYAASGLLTGFISLDLQGGIPYPISSVTLTSTPTLTPTPAPKYNLSGKVYYDVNNNGKFDYGEKAFIGGTITISNTKITRYLKISSQGNFILSANPTGIYTLRVSVPTSYRANSGNSMRINLNKNTIYNIGLQKITPVKTTCTSLGGACYAGHVCSKGKMTISNGPNSICSNGVCCR